MESRFRLDSELRNSDENSLARDVSPNKCPTPANIVRFMNMPQLTSTRLLLPKNVGEIALETFHELLKSSQGDALFAVLQSEQGGWRQPSLFGELGKGRIAARFLEELSEFFVEHRWHSRKMKARPFPMRNISLNLFQKRNNTGAAEPNLEKQLLTQGLMKRILLFCWASACVAFSILSPKTALGIDMPISIVGNPGNAADPSTGYGSVATTFGIGTYDVTLGQYTEFLNAVAQTDTYSLYNTNLATDLNIAGISRSGTSGSFTYSVIGNDQYPVTYVSWFDAARFTNWLSNGQPTGVEGNGTTETGAYTLNGDTSVGLETKNAGATWWIPNENEWYKAAYYDPTIRNYWPYATRTNAIPGNSIGSAPNEANIYSNVPSFSVTQMGTYSSTQNYLTPVGAFTSSTSAYGTYDQTGDVSNWADSVVVGKIGTFRGGSWGSVYSGISSSSRGGITNPAYESSGLGFRVATVPEPSAIILFAFGSTAFLIFRKKNNRQNFI